MRPLPQLVSWSVRERVKHRDHHAHDPNINRRIWRIAALVWPTVAAMASTHPARTLSSRRSIHHARPEVGSRLPVGKSSGKTHLDTEVPSVNVVAQEEIACCFWIVGKSCRRGPSRRGPRCRPSRLPRPRSWHRSRTTRHTI